MFMVHHVRLIEAVININAIFKLTDIYLIRVRFALGKRGRIKNR